MNTQHKSMNLKEWSLLLGLSAIWGSTFFFVEILLTVWPPFTIVFLRVSLGALGLWLYLFMRGRGVPKGFKIWFNLAGMSVLNNVLPFSLFIWAQISITGSLASILNGTMPIFTVLLGYILARDENVSGNKLFGAFIGFLGVAILIGFDALVHGAQENNVLAQLAVLATACCYALASLYGKRFRNMDITPSQTAAGQVTLSSIFIFPIMMIVDQPWTLPIGGIAVWASMLSVGIWGTSIAYIAYFRLLESVGAVNISICTFLIPIFAIVLGVSFLDEVLMPQHIIGMVVIGIGLSLIDGRLINRFRSRFSPGL